MLSPRAVEPIQPKDFDSNNHFQKKQSLELSFKHVTFQVKRRIWRKPFIEKKQILHGVSGDMLPGTLTAIMGPSGAGKSTLLNILAGYKVQGSGGQILVNGRERNPENMEEFLRLSCYITQDACMRDSLTVQEAMMMAAQLKLDRRATKKEKIQQVYQVLQMLGLGGSAHTMGSRLSGGQQKRLSIAFEMITNPPILFLDEPTTGLDSSSCSQCIQLLKTLARQGRTVLTTIHQPSALLFEMFDNVYAIAEGQCIYNGPTSQLVPYLADRGLRCPIYHNPADFLLEVAIGEYGPVLDRLFIPSYGVKDEKEKPNNRFSIKNFSLEEFKEGMMKKFLKSDKVFGPSHTASTRPNFFTEFYYLYMRNLTLLQRNYKYRLSTLGAHVICSTMLGFVFFGVGDNAAMARENLSFIFAVLIFIVYVGLMTVTVILPNDLKVMDVEHFNKWYTLPPYYLSLISVEIPMQVINVAVAFPILYLLADMPSEMFRFVMFFLFTILTSLTAQSFGFMMGSMLSMQIGVFVGPILSCVLCVFGFTLRFCDTPIYFKIPALASYVRSAYHSIAFTLFGFGRSPLQCKNELYCHFRAPEKLLKEIDAESVNVYANLTYLIAVTVGAHLLTLAYLNNRLTNR